MAQVISGDTPQQSAPAGDSKFTREFVGSAWRNQTNTGQEVINVRINRGCKLTFENAEGKKYQFVSGKDMNGLQLWPNNKREGKDTDPDLRISFRKP